METFSKRNHSSHEYSGYGEASVGLRNRLLLLYGLPYSGDEHLYAPGNHNWIHERKFSKDLQMHFGRTTPIESFRLSTSTSYSDVFDFIELYYARACADLDTRKRLLLFRDICVAFENSGSVYQFNSEGQVVLKINKELAESVTQTDNILEPFEKASRVYHESIDGLISRSMPAKNIVGNLSIVFEEYLQNISKQTTYEKSIQYLRDTLGLHPIQIQIIEKIKAYRGDVWGSAHAGNGTEPKEEDALWYVDSICTQIKYINIKSKKN
jgi:hypothetical protein